MKCKNCPKFIAIAQEGKPREASEYGICSMPSSHFPTAAENDCCYISSRITCKDCARFGEDFACFTADENDDASDCCGFIDICEENVLDSFRIWLSRSEYSREKIMKLCDEFEKSELYKHITNALPITNKTIDKG